MIRVWTEGRGSGVLSRYQRTGSTFSYVHGLAADRAVSVTMPVQPQSSSVAAGVAPIFEMNLPEGILRDRLRLAFAKATGTFDDLDLLSIVGRSQLGRLRYTDMDGTLEEVVPFLSVDTLLSSRRGGTLYRDLLEQFARLSGVSGVQPKFLIRDAGSFRGVEPEGHRLSATFCGATHIVKFWEEAEFPQLAANEFFCLRAAEACGLSVAPYQLTEDGVALIMDRFDLRADGTYRGFEDFCVLNARSTAQKYNGSYETHVIRRFGQFSRSPLCAQESLELFRLIALNCVVRNGDAHLKNFAILYDDATGEAHLAPCYDIVTTTAYNARDQMALTLNGSTAWPPAKELLRMGAAKNLGSPRELRRQMERVRDAVLQTRPELEAYAAAHPAFQEVARRMLEQWELGLRDLAA